MTAAFSICVYCGSREGRGGQFTAIAAEVGHWIGAHGGQLVYGGGNAGLMGVVANATQEAGGTVIGVIPQALVQREYAKLDCTELHVVDNMHDRKRLMAERAEAFLALPGGIGTMEEFFEVWTWRQLGYHDKPIGLLNSGGYYDALLTFLGDSVSHELMSEWQMDLVRVGSDPGRLLDELLQARGQSAGITDFSEI
jgi:uncharacterized protein (TIGR00730 family)